MTVTDVVMGVGLFVFGWYVGHCVRVVRATWRESREQVAAATRAADARWREATAPEPWPIPYPGHKIAEALPGGRGWYLTGPTPGVHGVWVEEAIYKEGGGVCWRQGPVAYVCSRNPHPDDPWHIAGVGDHYAVACWHAEDQPADREV